MHRGAWISHVCKVTASMLSGRQDAKIPLRNREAPGILDRSLCTGVGLRGKLKGSWCWAGVGRGQGDDGRPGDDGEGARR